MFIKIKTSIFNINLYIGLVTSVQSFKFMVGYSLIQFSTTLILYNLHSMPSDFMFLFWDLFLCSTLIVTMCMTDAYHKLSN